MQIELSPAERRALRARAHPLHPVASISERGLTEAVAREVDRCLRAHELIKVRTYGAERAQREAWLAELCDRLDAAPVQHIGHILVLYRPRPETSDETPPPDDGQAAGSRRRRRRTQT